MSYFMELASPHTEEAIKLIDKVGGLEWLIQKYEIDGSTAVKLDLSLDTPIIIVPTNSNSKELVLLYLSSLPSILFIFNYMISRILYFVILIDQSDTGNLSVGWC